MSIIRAPRPQTRYYVLDRRISEDKRLTWEARGLLVYLLGKPDNWQVSRQSLVNETKGSRKPSGRDAVLSCLIELIEAGYVARTIARDQNGRMAGYDYVVSEVPGTDSPDTAKPDTANPTQVSIDPKQGLRKEEQGLKNKAQASKSPALELPDWLPADAWKMWEEFRRAKSGRGWAAGAKALSIRELSKLRAAGHDPQAVIEQSIQRGWTGLFEVKQSIGATNARPSFAQQRAQAEIDAFVNGPADDNVIEMEVPRVGF